MAHKYDKEQSSYRVLEREGEIIEESSVKLVQELVQRPSASEFAQQTPIPSTTERVMGNLPFAVLASGLIATSVVGAGILGKYVYDKLIKPEEKKEIVEDKEDEKKSI